MAGAKPLQSFAAPGSKPLLSEKPGKPFGAPDSDVESEADDDENGSENTTPEEAERSASPEKDLEEKKKTKLQKGMYCASFISRFQDQRLTKTLPRS